MTALLVVAAILVGAMGFLQLSNATLGVGILCSACLLAILARIAQAADHHKQREARRNL